MPCCSPDFHSADIVQLFHRLASLVRNVRNPARLLPFRGFVARRRHARIPPKRVPLRSCARRTKYNRFGSCLAYRPITQRTRPRNRLPEIRIADRHNHGGRAPRKAKKPVRKNHPHEIAARKRLLRLRSRVRYRPEPQVNGRADQPQHKQTAQADAQRTARHSLGHHRESNARDQNQRRYKSKQQSRGKRLRRSSPGRRRYRAVKYQRPALRARPRIFQRVKTVSTRRALHSIHTTITNIAICWEPCWRNNIESRVTKAKTLPSGSPRFRKGILSMLRRIYESRRVIRKRSKGLGHG